MTERIDTIPGTNLRIIQDDKYFCYGIDAILLSSFASARRKDRVLDLGTGNGIIMLRLSALYQPKEVIGIEIQEELAQLAKRNIYLNKLEDRARVENINLKDLKNLFPSQSIDKIVTNPPYMKENSALKNPNKHLSIARHEIHCNLEDIFQVASYVLKDKGKLYMIHKSFRLVELLTLARKYKLEAKRLQFVQPTEKQDANLVLLEFSKNGSQEIQVLSPIIVYNEDRTYTQKIHEIYK